MSTAEVGKNISHKNGRIQGGNLRLFINNSHHHQDTRCIYLTSYLHLACSELPSTQRTLSNELRRSTSSDGSALVRTVTISRMSATTCVTAPTVNDLAAHSLGTGQTTTRRAGVLEVQDAGQHTHVVPTSNVMNIRLVRPWSLSRSWLLAVASLGSKTLVSSDIRRQE